MREEISEPQQWRTARSGASANSWSARRRSELPASLVDAAFEDETTHVTPVSGSRRDLAPQEAEESTPARLDIVQSLSTQLGMLEAQRKQLQRLLDEAQG